MRIEAGPLGEEHRLSQLLLEFCPQGNDLSPFQLARRLAEVRWGAQQSAAGGGEDETVEVVIATPMPVHPSQTPLVEEDEEPTKILLELPPELPEPPPIPSAVSNGNGRDVRQRTQEEMRLEIEMYLAEGRSALPPGPTLKEDIVRMHIAAWATARRMSLATARMNSAQIAKDIGLEERQVLIHLNAMIRYK